MTRRAASDHRDSSAQPEDTLLARRDVVILLVEEGAVRDTPPTGRVPGRRRLVDPGPEARERIELGLADCLGTAEASAVLAWLRQRDWTCEWELTADAYCRSRRPGPGALAAVSMLSAGALVILATARPALACAVALLVALLVYETARRRESRARRANVESRHDRTLDRRFRRSPISPLAWRDPCVSDAPPEADPHQGECRD